MDINKLSESIARATCAALVKLLDLLATAGLTKIGVRTTIHPDNVCYNYTIFNLLLNIGNIHIYIYIIYYRFIL